MCYCVDAMRRAGADFFERFDRLDRAAGDEDGEAGPGGGAGGAAAGAGAGRGVEGRDGAAPRKPGGGEDEEEEEGGEAEEEEAVFEEDDDYLQARAWSWRAAHAGAHGTVVLQQLALRHGCDSRTVQTCRRLAPPGCSRCRVSARCRHFAARVGPEARAQLSVRRWLHRATSMMTMRSMRTWTTAARRARRTDVPLTPRRLARRLARQHCGGYSSIVCHCLASRFPCAYDFCGLDRVWN